MPKLIIMRGLPASGKSTQAKEILKQDGNAVRLNRDLLRTMLHFDVWSGKKEGLTRDAEKVLARHFLDQNKNVIIDDTNLNPSVFESWKAFHPNREVFDFSHVDYMVCVGRDRYRLDSVGKSVIVNMARRYGLYESDREDVIVDIDGTLADITHRKKYVEQEKKDWKTFFSLMYKDAPRWDVINRVAKLSGQYNIVLVSGRPEEHRSATESWLDSYGVMDRAQTLIMRPKGDKRADDLVKNDILNQYFDKSKVYLVIDDRPRVIRMWRANGLMVEDVGDGIEF